MNTGERVMRYDTFHYDLRERIRVAENNTMRRRIDGAGVRAKGQSGADIARQHMIDRYMGIADQRLLTAERAYGLFTAGSGAEDARRRMIDRLQKKGAARQ